MDFIIDAIVEWLKGLLVDGIMGNLDGLFDNVNQSVGEIATQVGTTPADWNAGVFSMIRQISETAILPIAGVILTFVMTYELIQMLIERNNLHEVDTWMFFKWVFKTFVAVMILTNTFNIVLAVFDVSQHVIQQSAGIIQNGTEITPDVLDSLRTELEAMELGPLFGLWLQSFLIQLTMIALNIVIFVIVYGRMIEIYLLTSLAALKAANGNAVTAQGVDLPAQLRTAHLEAALQLPAGDGICLALVVKRKIFREGFVDCHSSSFPEPLSRNRRQKERKKEGAAFPRPGIRPLAVIFFIHSVHPERTAFYMLL